MNTNPYKLTISLNVLYHLGINLYSNVPAVLTELVANCWDADATIVEITIDSANDKIIIKDNGVGMDVKDINGRFLNVGYERRKDSPSVTNLGRHVMGRKGIGKLSAFSIANTVEVQSIKNAEKNGFIMKIDDIKKKIDRNNNPQKTRRQKTSDEKEYLPVPIDKRKIKITKGTLLTLTEIKKNISTSDKFLRKRLARRFSVIGNEKKFTVKLNGKPITIEDRDYFKSLQYVWYFGEKSEVYAEQSSKADKKIILEGSIDTEHDFKVSGWIGTVFEQDNIEEEENIIVVHSHGKLVQEDILKDLKEEKLYTYYLMGEINADFLDDDNQDDIVTSDRQRIKEDDPRYVKLKGFIEGILRNEVKKNWEKWRREKGAEDIVNANPLVGQWLAKLKGDNRKMANNLLGKINTYKIKDAAAKRELIKSTIIGFEKLARSNSLELIETINQSTAVEVIKGIFSSINEIEAYEFYEINKGRLNVIKKFEDLLPHSKERVLQEYLFKNLWLLNPAWERSTDETTKMEKTVNTVFKTRVESLLPKEKVGRIDIYYKSSTGEHHIIELKKYDVEVTNADLIEQVEKYRNAFEKVLKEKYPNEVNGKIWITCVLGKPPGPYSDTDAIKRHKKALDAYDASFRTYDELIKDASSSYSGYIQKETEISELTQIIDAIDKS